MERPWHKRAVELEPKEGPYCDYVAWREWVAKRESELVDGGDVLGSLDYQDAINLYVLFCEVADAAHDTREAAHAT